MRRKSRNPRQRCVRQLRSRAIREAGHCEHRNIPHQRPDKFRHAIAQGRCGRKQCCLQYACGGIVIAGLIGFWRSKTGNIEIHTSVWAEDYQEASES